jgi:hypothetical protein
MSKNNHLSTEELLDFLENRLDPATLEKVSEHISSGCSDCANNLTTFRRLLQAMEASAWPAPSAQAHKRAVEVFHLPFLQKFRQQRTIIFHPVFIGLALIALILVILFRNSSHQPVYAANLENVTGRVDLKATSSASWQASSSGQSVPLGATIRTASNGQAVLIFPDGTRTTLGPDTQLELTRLSQTDGQWRITITQTSGETEVVSTLKTTLFRIQTAAGFTDTNEADFSLRVEENGTTVVSVKEGSVKAISPAGSLSIFSGETGLLHKNSPPTTPIPSSISATPTSTPSETPASEGDAQNNQTTVSPSQEGTNEPNNNSNNTSNNDPSASNTSESNQQSPTTSPLPEGTQQPDGNN